MNTFLYELRKESVARAREDFKTYDNAGVLYFTTSLSGEVGEVLERLLLEDQPALSLEVGSGLAASTGLLCNLIKKVARAKVGGPDVGNSIRVENINTAKLSEEIAGAFIYLDLLASLYDIDLCEAVIETFNRVSDKLNSVHRLPESRVA